MLTRINGAALQPIFKSRAEVDHVPRRQPSIDSEQQRKRAIDIDQIEA